MRLRKKYATILLRKNSCVALRYGMLEISSNCLSMRAENNIHENSAAQQPQVMGCGRGQRYRTAVCNVVPDWPLSSFTAAAINLPTSRNDNQRKLNYQYL